MKLSEIRTAVRRHRGKVYVGVMSPMNTCMYVQVQKLHIIKALSHKAARDDAYTVVIMGDTLFVDANYRSNK